MGVLRFFVFLYILLKRSLFTVRKEIIKPFSLKIISGVEFLQNCYIMVKKIIVAMQFLNLHRQQFAIAFSCSFDILDLALFQIC